MLTLAAIAMQMQREWIKGAPSFNAALNFTSLPEPSHSHRDLSTQLQMQKTGWEPVLNGPLDPFADKQKRYLFISR